MTQYSSLNDNELASLLQQSDTRAYTEIYKRFFGILYIHACSRIEDDQQAKDLLQEMFISIWEKRHQLNLTGNFSSYLYASIRNRILNHLKHHKIAATYLQSLVNYESLDYNYADHKIRENQLKRAIEREIDLLPGNMREIFIMSRKQYMTHKEIAEHLDLTEQAVRSQVKRALKILRVKLGLYVFLLCLFKIL